jgi:hypothetical protein
VICRSLSGQLDSIEPLHCTHEEIGVVKGQGSGCPQFQAARFWRGRAGRGAGGFAAWSYAGIWHQHVLAARHVNGAEFQTDPLPKFDFAAQALTLDHCPSQAASVGGRCPGKVQHITTRYRRSVDL